MRVGIVGAGIAGLACAGGLVRLGHEVVLFDKGRGPGGRMSTRRIETSPYGTAHVDHGSPSYGTAHFDHGAQYFTVRDSQFGAQVDSWIAAGVVAPWPAAGDDAYVGLPAMNAPVRALAGRHVVHWSALVTSLEHRGPGWRLSVEGAPEVGGIHDVDLAVIAIPAEQAAALLTDVAAEPAARARAAISEPCWTAMLAFPQPVAVHADCWRGAAEGVVGWACRNNAKPGRTGPESWVVQASPSWSRRHLDADRGSVAADLAAALARETEVQLPDPIATAAHLWRFARCAPGGAGVIYDHGRRLGLCGDWLIGPRVESAWLSGFRLAERIGAEP